MHPSPLRELGLPNIGLIVALISTFPSQKWMQTKIKQTFRKTAMPSRSLNSGEHWQSRSWKTPLVDTGTGGSGVGIRSRMELHKLITKPPFTRYGFQIRASGIKSRVNNRALDATNVLNIRAPTVHFVKEILYLLIALLFMFYKKKVLHNQPLNSMIRFFDFLVLL